MALYGVDISKWQSVGTGDQAQDFVICKATEGVGYVDSTCDRHYQRAKSQGKLLGVYHFARPDLNKGADGARREAEFFVNNCKGYIGQAILVLDWEQPGTTWQTDWAKAWLDHVYALTGVRPLIYMSASVVSANNWSAISNTYGLWIAGYPSKYNVKNPPVPASSNMPYKIGTWRFWAIWQYSSSAGTLDRNIANMPRESWSKYASTIYQQKPEEPKPEPKPEEKPTESQKPTTYPSDTPDDNRQDTETVVPEQPTSTDTGLTVEEYNAIIEKGEQTVELAKNTIKKFGISIPMPSKLYDVLKVVATTVLPLISFVYLGLANIWGLGFGEQVDSTVQLIIAAINTILGATIIKSSSDYHKGDIK